MAAEPVIGICAAHERAQWSFWDQPAHLVADPYVSSMQRTGAIAMLIPADARGPLGALDRVDALMLIGGADVDPASYGQPREPATEATYPDRDEFEIALVRDALRRRTPLLGICRGMQILNVALGGTLVQHLPYADGVNLHRRALGTFEGTEHTVLLAEGSLVARAAGELETVVHCHHHQAVADLGEGLLVSGRAAADGVCEAVEASDGSFVMGVQWHPEANERSRLFAALADAARSRMQARDGPAFAVG